MEDAVDDNYRGVWRSSSRRRLPKGCAIRGYEGHRSSFVGKHDLTIPVDGEDQKMHDQELLEADARKNLPLLSLEAKLSCNTIPIVEE